MKVLSVKVKDDLYEEIERARAEMAMTKTEFMTMALALSIGSYRHVKERIESNMTVAHPTGSGSKAVAEAYHESRYH